MKLFRCGSWLSLCVLVLFAGMMLFAVSCDDDDDDDDDATDDDATDDDATDDDATDDDVIDDDATDDDATDDDATDDDATDDDDDDDDDDDVVDTDPDAVKWTSESVFEGIASNEDFYDLAFTPYGEPVIVFHDPAGYFNPKSGPLYIAVKTEDGKGWQTEVLDDNGGAVGLSPKIAIDDTGRIVVSYVSYTTFDGNTLRVAINDGGGDWDFIDIEQGTLLGGGPGESTCLAFDREGELYLANDRTGNPVVGFSLYTETSPGTFEAEAGFEDVRMWDGITIAFNAENRLGAAFYTGLPAEEGYEYGQVNVGFRNDSGGWPHEMAYQHAEVNGLDEKLGFNWRGNEAILFFSADDSANQGVYSLEFDGDAWQTKAFDDPCSEVLGPVDTLTGADDETIWVGYSCREPREIPRLVRYRGAVGAFYDIVDNMSYGRDPVVAIAPDGMPAVVYWSFQSSTLFYAKAEPKPGS